MGLSPVAVATQVLRKGRPGRWRRVRVADGGDSEGGPVAVRQGPTSADVGVDREISAEKHPDGQLRNPLAQHD